VSPFFLIQIRHTALSLAIFAALWGGIFIEGGGLFTIYQYSGYAMVCLKV
jgi:hypothetical protein